MQHTHRDATSSSSLRVCCVTAAHDNSATQPECEPMIVSKKRDRERRLETGSAPGDERATQIEETSE